MSDIARNFKINIVSSYDAAGNQAAAAGLQDVGKATGKLGEVTEEGAKSAEKLGVSERALHQIFHLIARESGPGAGAAIAGVGAVGGGGIMIGVLAVKELVEWIHKLSEESKKAREDMEMISISLRDAQAAADEFFNKVIKGQAEQRDGAELVAAAYEHQKVELEAVLSAEKKILEAEGKTKEAAAAEMETGQKKLDLLEEQLNQLKAQGPELENSEKLIASDIAYRTANPAAPSGFKIDPEKEAKLKVDARESLAALDRYNAGNSLPWEQGGREGFEQAAQKSGEALTTYEKNKQAVTDYNAALEAEKEELAKTTAARKKNEEAIAKQTESLANEKTKFAGQFGGEELQKAIALSQRAGAGGTLNASEGQFVQSIGSMVSGQSLSLARAEQLLQVAAQNPQLLAKLLERIIGVLERMPNPHATEARLAALEAKFSNLPAMRGSPSGQ